MRNALFFRDDFFLDEIMRKTNVVVVSVEYRLAPEDPYPAAIEDCCDVAEWLVKNSKEKVRRYI